MNEKESTFWVLIRFEADYDGDYECFSAAWKGKPSFLELKTATGLSDANCGHLIRRGHNKCVKQKYQDGYWFYLKEISFGKAYVRGFFSGQEEDD